MINTRAYTLLCYILAHIFQTDIITEAPPSSRRPSRYVHLRTLAPPGLEPKRISVLSADARWLVPTFKY